MGEAAAWSDDQRAEDTRSGDTPGGEPASGADVAGSSGADVAGEADAGTRRPRGPRALLSGLFRRSWPPQEWPLAIVIIGVGLSLLVVALEDFRPGTVLFAGCLFLAALFRLVLPDRQAGLLVLRSRIVDVLLMLIMALTILLLALLVPELPEGGLPALPQ